MPSRTQARNILLPISTVLIFTCSLLGQQTAPRRIVEPIDDGNVSRLQGSVNPRARREFDHGRIASAATLQQMSIFFHPAALQQSELEKLLREQQDSSSPNFHRWLTPDQYAERFGLHPADATAVVQWLQSRGFTSVQSARSRSFISFNGTAAQAEAAFHTTIHRFVVNRTQHYANVTEPALPIAFASLVTGLSGLHDFRPHARPIAHYTSSISGKHFLAPDDFATIYNLKALYGSGIDGSGQAIAIVGQTKLSSDTNGNYPDLVAFRTASKLPAINLQTVLVGADPGVTSGDIDEANLDIEWASSIARNAKIFFVYSKNALFTSLPNIVDNNLAPVISISYGDCEANYSTSDWQTIETLGQHANAQGQTIIVAAGDSGAADCDGNANKQVSIATHGLAVDYPASSAYVTAMGGTEFTGDPAAQVVNNVAQDTQYWKGSSDPNDTSASALSYIPETVWNDTANAGVLDAGGGGVSKLFSKPSWQTGVGVPADGKRDVPDISLASSPEHDGYLICSQASCVTGYRRSDQTLNVIGGTSAAAPVFAGVVALMNQKFGVRQGNVNPSLYSLAASAPTAFHDITTGDNMVPCQAMTPDCPNGGNIGYTAAVGYDLASGLGSVDAGALIAAWSNTVTPDFQISSNPQSLSLTRGGNGSTTLSTTAIGTFSGTVSLTCTVSTPLGSTTCSASPGSVTPGQNATLTVTATTSARLERSPSSRGFWTAGSFSLGFFLLSAGSRRSLWRKFRMTVLSLLLFALLLPMISCGGGSSSSVSNNNVARPLLGTVTVTGASGSLNHTTTISVTIN